MVQLAIFDRLHCLWFTVDQFSSESKLTRLLLKKRVKMRHNLEVISNAKIFVFAIHFKEVYCMDTDWILFFFLYFAQYYTINGSITTNMELFLTQLILEFLFIKKKSNDNSIVFMLFTVVILTICSIVNANSYL